MSTLYYESSFTHHGVKGMKWGVRRYQNPDGTLTASGKKREQRMLNRTIKKDRRTRFKNRRELSDDDLKKVVARLELEKRYKDLSNEDLRPGAKFISDTMRSTTGKTITTLVTGVVAKQVTSAINNYISKKVSGD